MNPERRAGLRRNARRAAQAVALGLVLATAADFIHPSNPGQKDHESNAPVAGYDPVDCKSTLESSEYFDLKPGEEFLVGIWPINAKDRDLYLFGSKIDGKMLLSNPDREYTIGIVGETVMSDGVTYRVRIDGQCLE